MCVCARSLQSSPTLCDSADCSPHCLVAQSVKNLPAAQGTCVGYLGQEDALEQEMAAHSRILAWKNSWTQEPGGLQSMASQRVRHD